MLSDEKIREIAVEIANKPEEWRHEADIEFTLKQARDLFASANLVVVDLAELEAALKPLAVLKIPFKPQGNAGAYSLRFSDIERAAALLAALTQEMKA